MGRVKTFTNGGSLLPGDLNSIEDDYEFAFSTWKSVTHAVSNIAGSAAAGTYMFIQGGSAVVSGSTVSPGLMPPLFWIDPAEFTANTRTDNFRVAATIVPNATAPGINFTFGLYPVAVSAGGAGFISLTLGAVVAGSTVAINTPGASAPSHAESAAFTIGAAAFYIPGVVTSGANAANNLSLIAARLQVKQV